MPRPIHCLLSALFPVFLFFPIERGKVQLGQAPSAEPPSPGTNDRPREFAAGVSIDWGQRTVLVDGQVVLRQGELELFACGARTKEHESIVVIRARPMHVFQALGLLGLEPGSPVRYDPHADRWHEAKGDALELRVRYSDSGLEFTVPLEDWLTDVKTGEKPRKLDWVFAGSRTLSNGRFAADVEGTVVTLVDFETALIAVASLHSADNQWLWLAARTTAIPPLDTPCTLLIRRGGEGTRELQIGVDKNAQFSVGGSAVSIDDLAKRWASLKTEGPPPAIVLKLSAGVSKESVESACEQLQKTGIARQAVELRPPEPATEKARTPERR